MLFPPTVQGTGSVFLSVVENRNEQGVAELGLV